MLLAALGAYVVALQVGAVAAPALGSVLLADPLYLGASALAPLLVLARAPGAAHGERAAWALIGLGALLWVGGDAWWTLALPEGDDVPVPSLADAGYLAFYPLVFGGIALLVRARTARAPRTTWLDGITAGLAAGAASAATVLQIVVDNTEGSFWSVATNLAYPVGDVVLVGVVVSALALRGWRLDLAFSALAVGLTGFWIADSAYLVATATGVYAEPNPFDQGWTLCLLLCALAAWAPAGRTAVAAERTPTTRTIVLPLAFAVIALMVLVTGAFLDRNPLAIGLAGAALSTVLVRLAVTVRAHLALLDATRREALTDALTGLGNRRALTRALDHRLQAASVTPHVLVLMDLDGFKHYNDTFGHPAGDSLLARLGRCLADAVGAEHAFRMGGDEFCVLLALAGRDAGTIVDRAARALSERGEGFQVGCSWGAIVLPDEADSASAALRIADQRMYARKARGRISAGRQSKDVLLRALAERHPDLGLHLSDVADLAERTARALELAPKVVEEIRQAAELHDVGKVAVPDAILNKPGPLDDAEWEFIRRHTVIGERIVSAAPSLLPVATLVRSSHERFDGRGYPDRLAGSAIPLGARIVAVCDAYDAMTTDRPYRRAMAPAAAVAELRACAGGQFDPDVVEAFATALERVPETRAALVA